MKGSIRFSEAWFFAGRGQSFSDQWTKAELEAFLEFESGLRKDIPIFGAVVAIFLPPPEISPFRPGRFWEICWAIGRALC
jgi:hypothetical protein